jgi:hypothetical protein
MQSFTCTALLGIHSLFCATFTNPAITVFGLHFHTVLLHLQNNYRVSLNPNQTSLVGLGCSGFARHYSRNHIRFLFLGLLRCFTSPCFALIDYEFIDQ